MYGPKDLLEKIHALLSYKNKAAEKELRRFYLTMKKREMAIYQQNGGELPDDYKEWKTQKLQELKDAVLVHLTQWTAAPRPPCAYPAPSGAGLVVPTGLIPEILQWVNDNGITEFSYEDKRDFDLPKRMLSGSKPSRLRRPQVEGLKILTSPPDSPRMIPGIGTLRIATGCGKTLLAQELIRHHGVPSIFLVPSTPILKQTVKRFESAFGKKNVKAFGGGKKDIGYVTVATYQSIAKAKPDELEELKKVSLKIGDEIHHVGAETFFQASKNIPNAVYSYGLTAYEERADGGTMMVTAATGPVIYDYPAEEGIKDKYLALPGFMIYSVYTTSGEWTQYKEKKVGGKPQRVAVKKVKSIQYDGDNSLEAYRHWVLGNDILNKTVAEMANGIASEGKSVLILVDEVEHGKILHDLIPGSGYCTGGSKDNEFLMAQFNKRQLKVLIGTSTLSEGADTIPVDYLFNMQGGASISQTKQADGRALRNEEDENGVPQKPETTIIDFDFPLCKMLHRHCRIREKVHATIGEVHRTNLI